MSRKPHHGDPRHYEEDIAKLKKRIEELESRNEQLEKDSNGKLTRDEWYKEYAQW